MFKFLLYKEYTMNKEIIIRIIRETIKEIQKKQEQEKKEEFIIIENYKNPKKKEYPKK